MPYTTSDRELVFVNVHVLLPQHCVSVFKLLVLLLLIGADVGEEGIGGEDTVEDNDVVDVDGGGRQP